MIERGLAVELAFDGEAGGTVLIHAIVLEVIELFLEVFLIDGAITFGSVFFGSLFKKGRHEVAHVGAGRGAAGRSNADDVFAGVLKFEVAEANDAVPVQGAGNGEAIDDRVFRSAVKEDFVFAPFDAGAIGTGGGFLGFEAPFNDGRFFPGKDGVIDDLAGSVVIEFELKG